MLDFPKLVRDLAQQRPVFHSEADLQHAFAWHLQKTYPKFQVRLEYPLSIGGRGAIDILIINGDERMGLEIKYPKQLLECTIGNENFSLRAQGAQDIRRYDILKDIQRMEKFVSKSPKISASVFVLSNDPTFWRGRSMPQTIDAAFDIRDGKTIQGTLNWGSNTGPGSKIGRETAICLGGTYTMNWHQYSKIDGPYGEFRFLHVPVQNKELV